MENSDSRNWIEHSYFANAVRVERIKGNTILG